MIGLDGPRMKICPVEWNKFLIVHSMDVDRILGKLRPIICLRSSWLYWLLKSAGEELVNLIQDMINGSLKDCRGHSCLEVVRMYQFLKKSTLDSGGLNNYSLVLNVLLLSKVFEWRVVGQLGFLDEIACLDLSQYSAVQGSQISSWGYHLGWIICSAICHLPFVGAVGCFRYCCLKYVFMAVSGNHMCLISSALK